MEQGHGLYLAPNKYERGVYFGPYKRGQGVATKKKKCQRADKNVLGRNYQRAIRRIRETTALFHCTVLTLQLLKLTSHGFAVVYRFCNAGRSTDQGVDLPRFKKKDFLFKIVTDDKNWILYKNLKRKKLWVS
ncbi:hypothetical protein ALC56_08123 [Trachymyrmex septentrionalis]|uniref:Uncharacterized protein n=1 Tax=Trachymyrmex septentrionalis TaxID=34720 RepID=A0A195FBC0_9HYME|nr:hypothetical protein ALC56_08123 [Trachymyrmex septentrionalis]